MCNISVLKGQTLTNICIQNDVEEGDLIIFNTAEAKTYKMYHKQDCCESVYIKDVYGDLDDLVNSPIVEAEEVSNSTSDKDKDESKTWTFYKLRTAKGSVIIRWYGTSNGYYSETAEFKEVNSS